MKPTLCSALLKTALLIVLLSLSFHGLTMAQARDKSVLSPGPVRPGQLDYRTELPRGFLIVYSATDAFDDGGVAYYAHSSYAIFTTDGKLFKKVENHISRSDEIPEVVALPVGSYVIEARSEKHEMSACALSSRKAGGRPWTWIWETRNHPGGSHTTDGSKNT